ncbi:MAG TPA: CheR family methyltransferase [Azospirillaceae bacterium]|nr:CheR family methyltransferase [Azospirillaceae bacterium]
MSNGTPPIVGIGASAGGIAALEAFFRAMPVDSGLAFVVLTHLAPQQDSSLPAILANYTAMPVAAAMDGVEPQPDHVYVLPSSMVLTIAEGRLRSRALPGFTREYHPVDVFFSSLALDRGEAAAAIVLSGGGSDGALGLKAVKERGGLTIAQGNGPTRPRHDGMPSSAIATGAVDLVLPAEAMPGPLLEFARSLALFEQAETTPEPPAPLLALERLQPAVCAVLRDQVGHDFRGYKEKTFMRRLHRRLQVRGVAGAEEYLELLGRDPEEVRALFRDLLIGVTGFFRDPDAFDLMEREVIPALLAGRAADDTVRIWVPGCATGEEAYSIAMLLREAMDRLDVRPQVQLFATDIDDAALATARLGRYPAALLTGIGPERLRRFFMPSGNGMAVSKEIRDLCIFSSHSIVRDPPFSRMDLISCRNLLIYLGPELQAKVLPMFHYALRPKGYLFLGISENVTQHAALFSPVDKKHRLFQRLDPVGPTASHASFVAGPRSPAVTPPSLRTEAPPSGSALRRCVEVRMLEQFAPPHVVVSAAGDVVYFSPRTGKYLEPPAGLPNRQLMAMARRGLRLELRLAFQTVLETQRPVHREGLSVEIGDLVQILNLIIEPLPREDGENLFLVVFQDVGAPAPAGAAGMPLLGPADGGSAIDHLEREVRETRERLQSTIEEYEATLEELKSANEELLSFNEEIQSTNEELETSKEEIHSMNEELQTVNSELGAKVDELDQANSDLRNLFESTRVGTLFLGADLAVRSFTPMATTLFSLIPSDCGRPLDDVVSQIDMKKFKADVREVLRRATSVERRLTRRDGGAHYLLRVIPYRRSSGAVDGVVATFIDVTSLVRAETDRSAFLETMRRRAWINRALVALQADHALAAGDMDAVRADLARRLDALERLYELIFRHDWEMVRFGELLSLATEGAGWLRLDPGGPDLSIPADAALLLGVLLMELGAASPGQSASAPASGTCTTTWRVEDGRGLLAFSIRWANAADAARFAALLAPSCAWISHRFGATGGVRVVCGARSEVQEIEISQKVPGPA